jgi:hypothetical protein
MRSVIGAGLGFMVTGTFLVACGSNGNKAPLPSAAMCTGPAQTAPEANSVASISENVDTTCASVVGFEHWKMGAIGSACTSPLDCTPVCCPCPDGTHHTLAGWCNQGQCAAGADVACMIDGTPLSSCDTN